MHFTPCAPGVCIHWEVCYMYFLFSGDSSTAPEIYLYLYLYVCEPYNSVCIDMFAYVIKSNFWLYFIFIFSYASLMYGLFHRCVIVTSAFILLFLWILYLCFLWYFFYFKRSFQSLSCIFPVHYLLCHFWHPR